MAWKVFADNWTTAEMTNTSKFCTIKFGRNIILRAIRTWIVVYNNPTFTEIDMRLYSNRVVNSQNTPGKLLATSDARAKSEIHTLANGVKEIWFEFQNVPVHGDTLYNLVINGVSYIGDETAHLSWMKAFPDPVYSVQSYTPLMINLPYAPYQCYAIGADL